MIIRPMLAAKATEDELKELFRKHKYLLLSPKIDGVRALVHNGQLLSRTMKPIRNTWTQNLFNQYQGLDGELCVGNPWDKNLMQNTTSGVMSINGKPDVTYWVFDMWDVAGEFLRRYEKLKYDVDPLSSDVVSAVKVVPHTNVYSYEELLEYESEYLTKGYEGVMLRRPDGYYKQNRSTLREAGLVKVKRFQDYEARVIGYEPLYRNTNEAGLDERGYTKRSTAQDGRKADELLGCLLARDSTNGSTFSVGSGFTESQRRHLWENREKLLDKIIKYKCFTATGTKDKPRFPIFLGFRHEDDM